MQFPWSVVIVALALGLSYASRPLVERAKADSPRWQQRSNGTRRFLSGLPGYAVGAAIGVVLLLLFDHQP